MKLMPRAYATATAILLVAGLVIAAPPSVIKEFSGKVIGITDGDTIKVLVNKATVKVRLEGIDSPESGQAFGRKAKEALAESVAGRIVTVRKTGTDRYQRTLGVILVNGVDVNAKLVKDGWAWHYKKYSSDENLAKLEDAARAAKRGLWADANALAPWEYRARQKAPKAAPQASKDQEMSYWLNTSSGVRHNQSCEHFHNTKRGRFCSPGEGKPCGICGG